MDRRVLLRLFVPLYAAQFLGIGFLFTGLVAISRDRGGSLDEIGIIYVLGTVWAVKFLWAPLVDRFGSRRHGHYRSWLLVTQPATALLILAIAPLDVIGDMWLVIGALALVAILSATQDIATDGLAVRVTSGGSRGTVNGVQVGGGFIGDIVGGGLVLVIYDVAGWVPAVVSLAVFTAIPVLFIKQYREPQFIPSVATGQRVRRGSVFAMLRQPGAARWTFVLTPLLVLGMPGAYGLLVPILVDAGVSVGLVGVLTNIVGGAIGIGAAVAAGAVSARMGRKRGLVVYGIGQVVAIAATIPVAAGGGWLWAILAIFLLNVFNSAMYVALYTINMDYARAETAGSDFTFQVSVAFFVRFAAAGVAMTVAESAGYSSALLLCAGLAVAGVLATVALYQERRPAEESVPTDAVPATAHTPVSSAA